MKKITRLTAEQRARMPEWRDKWIANGLSCTPMTDDDRSSVDHALRAMYRAANLKEPRVVVFVPSPLVLRIAGGIAAGVFLTKRRGWPVDDAVHGAVHDAVDGAVDGAVRDAVRDAVDGAVRDAVHGAVDGAVRYLLLCASSAWRMERGGNMWSAWPAWISFFRDVCGLDLPEWNNFGHLETTQSACGPYIIHEDFAMVSDRPQFIKRDAGARLHGEDGPAIRWRDGSRFYFWHGFRLSRATEWIIAKRDRLSAAIIDVEKNAELRRIMLEIYGFDRYLAERSANIIDIDELHGQPRRLMEIRIGDEALRVVEVINGSDEPDGTRRKFVLGAARASNRDLPKTARAAIAASYGISAKIYREAVRS